MNNLDPISGFDFQLLYDGRKVAHFQALTLSVHPSLPGVYNIDFKLEQGLCDIDWFKHHVNVKDQERQEVKLDLEFEIAFESNFNTADVAPQQSVAGIYKLPCNLNVFHFGFMPSGRTAVITFGGTASSINFLPH